MKKYKSVIFPGLSVVLLIGLAVLVPDKGEAALRNTLSTIVTALRIIIPVYLLIALTDVWVPRETFVRWMGRESGAAAFFFAFLIGTLGAGPLYVAFPLTALLAAKGVRLSAILFLLGVWTSTKLPIIMYELGLFGALFTTIHVCTSLGSYLLGSIVIEKLLHPRQQARIYSRLAGLST